MSDSLPLARPNITQAEIDAVKAEYEARIAEVSAGAERQALDRLTDRLLTLSGFDPARAPKGNGA